MGYFIFNDNDGNFLQYMKLTGIPQKDIKQDVLDTCDYLQGNIDIPIFSQRFVNLMTPILKMKYIFIQSTSTIIIPILHFILQRF